MILSGVGRGLLGRLADQLQHGGNVLHILLARLLGFRAGAEVIVALRQANPALIDHGNLFLRVLEILLLAVAEKCADVDHLVVREEIGQLLLAAQRRDAVKFWLQWLEAFGVDRIFIHAAGVVVADLLLVGGALRARLGSLVEQVLQNVLCVVVDHRELVVRRPVGRNGVELVEVSARVLIKVDASVGAGVDQLLVEAGQ